MANPYMIAANKRHQQNMARIAASRRSKNAVAPKKRTIAKMPEPPMPDIIVTLLSDPSDYEDTTTIVGQNISGVEVGRFAITREQTMLVRDARNLMAAWDCAKGGRLRILTAHGRLLEGQDDSKLLSDVLYCGQNEHPLGTASCDAQQEPCSVVANRDSYVHSDVHDEGDAHNECNAPDETDVSDDQIPAYSLCNGCKAWLYSLVGKGGLK